TGVGGDEVRGEDGFHLAGPAIRLVPDRVFAGDDQGVDVEFAAQRIDVAGGGQCGDVDTGPCEVIHAWQRCGDAEERRNAVFELEAVSNAATEGDPAAGEHSVELLVTGVVEVLEVNLRGSAKLHFGRRGKDVIESCVGVAELLVDGTEAVAALRLRDHRIG